MAYSSVHKKFYFITDNDVILLSNLKLYIITRNLDSPVICLDINQIFSIEFGEEVEEGPGVARGRTLDTLVLEYYDKSKFNKGMLKKKDPFDTAVQKLKLKLAKVNQKVKAEFEERIKLEQAENFAIFF
jgi:hypothetical protein